MVTRIFLLPMSFWPWAHTVKWHWYITHKTHSFITKCMNMCRRDVTQAFIDYTQTSQFLSQNAWICVQAWNMHSLITHNPHSFITKCMNMCKHDSSIHWIGYSIYQGFSNLFLEGPDEIPMKPQRAGWGPSEASKGRNIGQYQY